MKEQVAYTQDGTFSVVFRENLSLPLGFVNGLPN